MKKNLPTPTDPLEQSPENALELLGKIVGDNRDLRQIVAVLRAENDELKTENTKLTAFKAWVHKYLDDKGIPAVIAGPHSIEGCRIGDRMDYVFAELSRLSSTSASDKGIEEKVDAAITNLAREHDTTKPIEALVIREYVLEELRGAPLPPNAGERSPKLIHGAPTYNGTWFLHKDKHWHKIGVLCYQNYSECGIDMSYGPIVNDVFEDGTEYECFECGQLPTDNKKECKVCNPADELDAAVGDTEAKP